MKRSIPLVAIAAVLLASPILQTKDSAAPPPEKGDKSSRLTDADNKKTLKMPVGMSFDVALKGNATTGFQWQVGRIEGDGVRQRGKGDYLPDEHPAQMVGVGGTFIFHFNVVKAAKTTIRLVYVRPWEKDKPSEKTFEVTIDSSIATAAEATLVFEGTVLSIENSPLPESTQNFIVTMQVDRVLQGTFKGKTFQFRIHSPVRSGLNLKEKYPVTAKRVNGSYTVDQNQWMRPLVPSASAPIVAASFTAGKEIVIVPDPRRLASMGLTAAQLEPLRWKRFSLGSASAKIGGKTVKLADVALVTERDLQVRPFTVALSDGREAIITPDAIKVGRYLIPAWAFEKDVRTRLSQAAGTDPAKVQVLVDIPVPGGRVPNYWKKDHIHISVGEPLGALAKVEVRRPSPPPSQAPRKSL